MKKRSLTKKEQRQIVKVILGVVASALLWTPIDNFITNLLGNGNGRLITGVLFLVALAYFWRLDL